MEKDDKYTSSTFVVHCDSVIDIARVAQETYKECGLVPFYFTKGYIDRIDYV